MAKIFNASQKYCCKLLVLFCYLFNQQFVYSFYSFSSSSDNLIYEKDNIDFNEDITSLSENHTQIGIKIFTKNELSLSKYNKLDIDGIKEKVTEDDILNIAKTATIYKNKKIEDFYLQNIITDYYCKIWLQDNSRQITNDKIISNKRFFFKNIITTIHLEEFNLTTNTGNIDTNTMSYLASLQKNNFNLKFITTTFSKAEDISFGSHGGRTINYYYELTDNNVLHISYRIFALKKENEYNSIASRSIGLWNIVKNNLIKEQVNSSMESIEAIKNHLDAT